MLNLDTFYQTKTDNSDRAEGHIYENKSYRCEIACCGQPLIKSHHVTGLKLDNIRHILQSLLKLGSNRGLSVSKGLYRSREICFLLEVERRGTKN